jgi:hypothetical protein
MKVLNRRQIDRQRLFIHSTISFFKVIRWWNALSKKIDKCKKRLAITFFPSCWTFCFAAFEAERSDKTLASSEKFNGHSHNIISWRWLPAKDKINLSNLIFWQPSCITNLIKGITSLLMLPWHQIWIWHIYKIIWTATNTALRSSTHFFSHMHSA